MIHVYHAKNPSFFVRPDFKYSPSDFVLVATVDTDDKEVAFQLTNSFVQDWWKNPGVTFHGSPDHGMDGCRSTSVGDLLHVNDIEVLAQAVTGLFLVDSCGFKEITSW